MPIAMTPAPPLAPEAQMQVQMLVEALLKRGMGGDQTVSPFDSQGMYDLEGKLGSRLHSYIGQQRQLGLNADTLVSPVMGP